MNFPFIPKQLTVYFNIIYMYFNIAIYILDFYLVLAYKTATFLQLTPQLFGRIIFQSVAFKESWGILMYIQCISWTDGKKIARLGSSLPFTLSLPVGMSTNIARGMIRPSAKRGGELLCMSRNKLRIMMGLLTGHCQLKEYLLQLGLAGTTGCERSRLLKHPHMFFVTVRHWQYHD